MKLLLDTHTLIWYADGSPQLSSDAEALIVDPTNERFLSMASVWEMAIKSGIGKITLSPNYREYLHRAVSSLQITILDITLEDCIKYEALPFPSEMHRDPYDRMIVVHALRHSFSLVSIDDKLDGYNVTRLW